jgi:hypothetical protein
MLLSDTDPLSVRASSFAVRPRPADRTNALIPAPVQVLGPAAVAQRLPPEESGRQASGPHGQDALRLLRTCAA